MHGRETFIDESNRIPKYPGILGYKSNHKLKTMAASTAEVKASINRLDKRFDAIAVRVSGLDKLIGSGDLPSLHRASDELKSVIAELTELKKEDVRIDSVIIDSIFSLHNRKICRI